jgi:GntR family transcriptional regulator
VNIKTVRQALLEAEGLVTPVRRRGTVVRQRPPMKRLGIEQDMPARVQAAYKRLTQAGYTTRRSASAYPSESRM